MNLLNVELRRLKMIEDAWEEQRIYPVSREQFIITARSILKEYKNKNPRHARYKTIERLARLTGQSYHDIDWKLHNWIGDR